MFLAYPGLKKSRDKPISIFDIFLVIIGLVTTLYIFFDYEGLVYRQGIMAKTNLFGFAIPYEVILGSLGIILLLEATRRAI